MKWIYVASDQKAKENVDLCAALVYGLTLPFALELV
jgi:hypothetical protein